MNYSLLISHAFGDINRIYNGNLLDYYSISPLPQWEGEYDRVEFLLLEMLGEGGWDYEDEVYSPDYATNFFSVQVEVTEGELPILTFRTTQGSRNVSVRFDGLNFLPIWNVSDLIDYLYHARDIVQSQFDYLNQLAKPYKHTVIHNIHL